MATSVQKLHVQVVLENFTGVDTDATVVKELTEDKTVS
jgi:hypothetical protein